MRNFLRVELDLADTMLGAAQRTNNQEHRAILLDQVQIAIRTTHYFMKAIKDKASQEEVQHRTAELEIEVRVHR